MDKGNKYLFTIRSLTGGGAERVVSVLASNMAEDGYDVSIIVYDKSEHDYPLSDKVKLFYMPEAKKNIWGKLGRIKDMKRLVDSIKPDIIIPFVGTVLFVSYFASREQKTPFIRTIRNSPWIEEGRGVNRILKRMLNYKAKAIMVQNEEQIAFFPQALRNKIFVIPNPLSESLIRTQKNAYHENVQKFITVGRLEEQKNHELLIRAFLRINTKYPDTRLEIYGTGHEYQRLKELIEELGLENKCLLMGRNDQIETALRDADAFILTSRYEGMPNALMEAMAVGLPCLSSDCKTGPKTLIQNHVNGFLFQEGNQDDLVEKWAWMIENPDTLQQAAQEARKSMLEKYTYRKIYKDLLYMLQQI